MQGYLVYAGTCIGDLSVRGRAVHSDQPVHRENVGDSLSLVCWGCAAGDVLYSVTRDRSILILNGYIAEANSMEEFETQQDATDLLLQIFDRETSVHRMMEIAASIHGSFSIVYCNLVEERTYCITDRIASRPTWVRKIRNAWAISSHVRPIAEINGDHELDLGSLGSFLLYGGPIEPTKSIYKNIRAVREATVEVLPLAGDPQARPWYTFRHIPDEKRSYREWVDLASQHVRRAAARIVNTTRTPLVFLSGGVDSRLTASALRSAGGTPLLVTLADSENLEVRIAKKIAESLTCKHETILRDRHWYLRSLPTAAYNAAGLYAWGHGHFSQAYKECQTRYAVDCALLGDFCEVFSKLCCVVDNSRKKSWTPEEFYRDFDRLVLPLYRPTDRTKTLDLLTSKVRDQVEEQLRTDIVRRYAGVQEISDDPKVIADYFLRWGNASTIATFFMFIDLRSAGPERSIMFDKDVHGLLEIMPSAVRDKANLGGAIVEAFPHRRKWSE